MASTLDKKLEVLLKVLKGRLDPVYKNFTEELEEFNDLPEDDGLEDDDVPDNNPPNSNPNPPLTSIPALPLRTVLDLSQPTVKAPKDAGVHHSSMLSVRETRPRSLYPQAWRQATGSSSRAITACFMRTRWVPYRRAVTRLPRRSRRPWTR